MNDFILPIIVGIIQLVSLFVSYQLGKRKQNTEIENISAQTKISEAEVQSRIVDDSLDISKSWREVAEYRESQIKILNDQLKSAILKIEKQAEINNELRTLNQKLVIRVEILEEKSKDRDALTMRTTKLERYARGVYEAFNYLVDVVGISHPDAVEIAKSKIPYIGFETNV